MNDRVIGIACLFWVVITGCEGIFSCKADNGENVDWFVGYKPPSIKQKRTVISSGKEFYYVDSRSGPNTANWTHSPFDIGDPAGALGSTLGQLYSGRRDPEVFYLVFNDQQTSRTDSYRGHTKGVLYFNGIQGFLLAHSVPKLVNLDNSEYSYPETGVRNGQSFLCITFDASALNDIGTHLLHTMPSIVSSQLPTTFGLKYLQIQRVIAGRTIDKGANTTSILKLSSSCCQRFVFIGKHKKFRKDLYADLVAPNVKATLFTETWLVGKGDLQPSCKTNQKVYNVRQIKFGRYSFTSNKDHSKWAVTDSEKLPVVCIGDINRQESQFNRAGGAICLRHPGLWRLYRQTVAEAEEC